jgi:hypothetical protein
MYKNKYNKYTNKLKQLGGLSCSLKVFDEVYIPQDNISGLITGLNYNINGESKKYEYPSVDEEIVDPHPELDVKCTSATVQKDNQPIVGNFDIPIQYLQDVNLLTREQFRGIRVVNYNNINVNVLGIWFAKFLKLDELIDLSGLNSHINNALASYRFDFYEQPLPDEMSLTDFRRIFPLAIGINLAYSEIEDDEFINNILPRHDPNNRKFKNILKINIGHCNHLTDKAFTILDTWIHTLDMRYCNSITDAGFVHLRGVHTLVMRSCYQETITDAAFTHLAGIHTLNMDVCNQFTITGNSFCLLNSLKKLSIYHCNRTTVNKAKKIFGVAQDDKFVKYFHPC